MKLLGLILFAVSSFSLAASESKTKLKRANCEESITTEILVKPNFSSIISFPVKPDKIVMGGKNQFSVEYIKNDLAVTSLGSNSKTNMFVYLFGRRCNFTLKTSPTIYDPLIVVFDPEEAKIKPRLL